MGFLLSSPYNGSHYNVPVAAVAQLNRAVSF